MKTRQQIVATIILIALYIIMGNARAVNPNPFIPGAVIALNMVVPVLAGIIFGRWVGLTTGILGTALNGLSPAGSAFEFAAIIPHGIMGFLAGAYKERLATPVLALFLVLGHLLNLAMFLLLGLMESATLASGHFWLGILYESFLGVVAIIIIAALYRSTVGKRT